MAEETEKTESSPLSSLGNAIPSLYYDVIGRVVPGTAFLMSWRNVRGHLDGDASHILLLVGFGYIVGMLMTPCYYVLTAPIVGSWKLLNYLFRNNKKWKIPENRGGRGNDVVGLARPDLGATLAKMQAEAVLCANLAAGFIFLKILPLSTYFNSELGTGLDPMPPPLAWSIVSFLVFIAWLRYAGWIGRQARLIELLDKDKMERSMLDDTARDLSPSRSDPSRVNQEIASSNSTIVPRTAENLLHDDSAAATRLPAVLGVPKSS